MIDVTKFEGHAKGPWKTERLVDKTGKPYSTLYECHIDIGPCMIWAPVGNKEQETNAALLAAAPELLAEVLRLRERNQRLESAFTEASELIGQSCGAWFPSRDGGYFEKWDDLFARFIPKFAELFDEAKKGGD